MISTIAALSILVHERARTRTRSRAHAHARTNTYAFTFTASDAKTSRRMLVHFYLFIHFTEVTQIVCNDHAHFTYSHGWILRHTVHQHKHYRFIDPPLLQFWVIATNAETSASLGTPILCKCWLLGSNLSETEAHHSPLHKPSQHYRREVFCAAGSAVVKLKATTTGGFSTMHIVGRVVCVDLLSQTGDSATNPSYSCPSQRRGDFQYKQVRRVNFICMQMCSVFLGCP